MTAPLRHPFCVFNRLRGHHTHVASRVAQVILVLGQAVPAQELHVLRAVELSNTLLVILFCLDLAVECVPKVTSYDGLSHSHLFRAGLVSWRVPESTGDIGNFSASLDCLCPVSLIDDRLHLLNLAELLNLFLFLRSFQADLLVVSLVLGTTVFSSSLLCDRLIF